MKIVHFGKEFNGYDNSEFIPSFVRILEDIQKEATLGIKSQIDKDAFMCDILSSVDENMANRFREEQTIMAKELIKDEKIAWLKSQPVNL